MQQYVGPIIFSVLVYLVSVRFFLMGREGLVKKKMFLTNRFGRYYVSLFVKTGPRYVVVGKKAQYIGYLYIFLGCTTFLLATLAGVEVFK